MSSTPVVKFEPSPADSLVDSFSSNPNSQYTSLFPEHQVLTPQSFDDDSMFGDDMAPQSPNEEDKKPVKKRKSWGQQLPEPKTNLPPRKRAKTEDEKEQRRVERVLRNRRAAQSSRERKRQEVEALEAEKMAIEQRNRDLEARLAEAEANNLRLLQQLEQATNGNMRVFQGTSATSSPVAEQLRASTPVTFSQELFGSRDQRSSISAQSMSESRTVNPASLSPSLRPVADSSNASSSDMTQHPAAMLCDLQCQSEAQRPWMSLPTPTQTSAAIFLLNMISAATSTLLSPITQITTSLATGAYLPPTTSILTLIIWMVTTTASLTTSSLMTSSTNTKTSRHSRRSVRMSLLRRLLSCNPHLARPLMDATMVAMRLASEQPLVLACLSRVDASRSASEKNSPSIEALTTLLWATHTISKEDHTKEESKLDVATEVRQACDELDEPFRQRKMQGTTRSWSRRVDTDVLGQKSLNNWRLARS